MSLVYLNRSILFENCHGRLVILEQHLVTMNIENISNEEQCLLFDEEHEELGWTEIPKYMITVIFALNILINHILNISE